MSWLCSTAEGSIRRHQLVYAHPRGWHLLLEKRADLAGDTLIAGWADRGWPLIGRRALPREGPGATVGLPLPPSAGKRRLSLLLPFTDISSTAPPPLLRVVDVAAPRAWHPTLARLDELAVRHGIEVRVFGGLAWQALTGLEYLGADSDLDILLPVRRDTNLHALSASLSAIDTAAPMRLDGEFIRADGVAINWREFHSGARDLLVKSHRGVVLLDAGDFLSAAKIT